MFCASAVHPPRLEQPKRPHNPYYGIALAVPIRFTPYMVDPRLEMKTFQSLWPDGTMESFALN